MRTHQDRSLLLNGIPNKDVINRSDSSAYADLASMIDHLDSLGPLSNGVNPLVIFIDNALARLRGFQIYQELDDIKQELMRKFGPGTIEG